MSQWLIPITAALAAPVLTFIGVAWKLSGRIGTSEAHQLWEESRSMRDEYRARLEYCETRLAALRSSLDDCGAQLVEISRENRSLRGELDRFGS